MLFNSVPISAGKIYFKRLNEYLQNDKSFAVESTLSGNNIIRIINGWHNVPQEDIIRRYYKSIIKFWDEYRLMVDEWAIFYNGYEYTPMMVSFGSSDNIQVVNEEMQNDFNNILKLARRKINGL